MCIASLAEIISIGSVLPFLGVLTSPDRVFYYPAAQPIIKVLNINSPNQLLLPLTLIFAFIALLTGAVRLLLLWASTRLSFAAGADLSIKIYHNTLHQPYAVHVARNSNEIISGISDKANSTTEIMTEFLSFLSSILILIIILITLISIDPVIALIIFSGFGIIYGYIIWITRERLFINGRLIAQESTNVIKSLQEGLGGIRDVLIDGSQASYCDIYQRADLRLRRAQGNNWFISRCPRYAVEALGLSLIAGAAYLLAERPDGIVKAIPVLGMLALGAQRLLPVLQQAYYAITFIRGNQASLQEALDLLDQPLPDYINQAVAQKLDFKFCLELKNISFRYDHSNPWVLRNINLKINKGNRIGFIGTTGSGKSTLLDIRMGLLQPTEGYLAIDNQKIFNNNYRNWQKNIAHVPQAIFLADTTIQENIALGVPKKYIDLDRVKLVAKTAQIDKLIESWPHQYNTIVGERGVRLSGGQRQRIGIARALYKNASVIIFDEATSALDHETESEVMNSIDQLSANLTILIIAHRLTTLQNCSEIIEIDNGKIGRIGNYHQIIGDAKNK
jgi:ATP-binding cassette subfamily B protein